VAENAYIHNMAYIPTQPPISLEFAEMSKKELKVYFEWFLKVIPGRIAHLRSAVNESSGLDNWSADFSPDSLLQLGNWFASEVETRPRTQDEMNAFQLNGHRIDVERHELTGRTASLAADVGMYLSQVFIQNFTCLQWSQPLGAKKSVDCGQPVLVGFGIVPFNPTRMLLGLAYGIASHEEGGGSLRELYDIWSRKIP